MTVEEYIQYRTGASSIPLILLNMFVKPFYSNSLHSFWKYWNPGFGFYLLYYCYKPIRNIFPHWISLMATFLISGLLHDLIYIVPMLFMNGVGFIFPFITIWFFIIAIGIFLTEWFQFDFRKVNPKIRPILHISYLISTFCLTRYFDRLISSVFGF